MIKYPLKLYPATKNTIWGGTHLKEMYGKEAPFDTLGETWELTCRDDGMSTIINGEYAGKTLKEYIIDNGVDVISKNFTGDRFPLLIKFLDANDDLSIQVHPDNEYSLKNENEYGKTEMWYILSAAPGAKIVYGLKPEFTIKDFEAATANGKTEECLNYVTCKAGDIFFIPSGQIHALGKGLVVAEIQQNSNVTYRIYDYNRLGKDGKPRELHIKKAIDSIKIMSNEEIHKLQFSKDNNPNIETIAHCEYFKVDKYDINGELKIARNKNSFISILALNGNGTIDTKNGIYEITKGDSYYIPADFDNFTIKGNIEIILTTL